MIVDARGLRCPWPALRAARVLRSAPTVEIEADDPAAARELAALASAQGLEFEALSPGRFRISQPRG
ncbi:sulfurtransferase TusA family protein [Sphingomonas sp. Y38-1Y]|uniref:sulfurtransferase TusA family protein n=1 Tax=Sphingomonas sp. Y38-1Y TaxID=3078265 RepID=UPI0028ED3885|nr:sulfurtransferase TusA family protein [Sphingomonas sp. Y38-1Y]